LSDADILLYSYLKIISSFDQFEAIKESLKIFGNVNDFYANLDNKYSNLIKERLNF